MSYIVPVHNMFHPHLFDHTAPLFMFSQQKNERHTLYNVNYLNHTFKNMFNCAVYLKIGLFHFTVFVFKNIEQELKIQVPVVRRSLHCYLFAISILRSKGNALQCTCIFVRKIMFYIRTLYVSASSINATARNLTKCLHTAYNLKYTCSAFIIFMPCWNTFTLDICTTQYLVQNLHKYMYM